VSLYNHDFYSVLLIFLLFLISIAFNNNRRQTNSLLRIPFNNKETYGSLYFQRNTNISFTRFLYFNIMALITSCYVSLLFKKLNFYDFIFLSFLILVFFFFKNVSILIFGLSLKKYSIFKKITIINIDINTFIAIYFYPILLFVSYYKFENMNFQFFISIIYVVVLYATRFFFIIKTNILSSLNLIHIICYICILEIIPLVLLYIIL
tara:strand:+ start:51687 stop:52307 length:621 start_codon:yes stop_codon:yes gene_type:complete